MPNFGNYILDAARLEGTLHLMSEWLYAEAGQIRLPDHRLRNDVTNPELGPPVDAFIANVDKIRRFWELGPHTLEVAAANIIALCKTAEEVTGQPLVPESDTALQQTIANETKARIEQKYERIALQAQAEGVYEATGHDLDAIKEATGYDLERGIKTFSEFVRHTTTMDAAIRLVLESQFTSAWTAFETLAEDLWKGAQKLHPTLVGSKGRFRRLESIKKTYAALTPIEATICGHYNNPNADIVSMFDKPDLRKLNLVRNVLVHTAGIIDQEFLDEANKVGWQPSDQLGQPIHIDGRRVKELINPVVEQGEQLIRAVNTWMMLITQKQATP